MSERLNRVLEEYYSTRTAQYLIVLRSYSSTVVVHVLYSSTPTVLSRSTRVLSTVQYCSTVQHRVSSVKADVIIYGGVHCTLSWSWFRKFIMTHARITVVMTHVTGQ